jgi:hypothetical protein
MKFAKVNGEGRGTREGASANIDTELVKGIRIVTP